MSTIEIINVVYFFPFSTISCNYQQKFQCHPSQDLLLKSISVYRSGLAEFGAPAWQGAEGQQMHVGKHTPSLPRRRLPFQCQLAEKKQAGYSEFFFKNGK